MDVSNAQFELYRNWIEWTHPIVRDRYNLWNCCIVTCQDSNIFWKGNMSEREPKPSYIGLFRSLGKLHLWKKDLKQARILYRLTLDCVYSAITILDRICYDFCIETDYICVSFFRFLCFFYLHNPMFIFLVALGEKDGRAFGQGAHDKRFCYCAPCSSIHHLVKVTSHNMVILSLSLVAYFSINRRKTDDVDHFIHSL